jgi:hypothetical protein
MAHFRLCKPGTIAHVEACIIEVLRADDCLTTTEIMSHPRLLNYFHGMRTLDIRPLGHHAILAWHPATRLRSSL